MPRPQLVTALDLGSDTLKMATIRKQGKGKEPELLVLEKIPSWGLRRGVVVNPEKVAEKIKKLGQLLSSATNRKLKEVVCNINGSHLFVTPSKGVVAVSRADQQISQEDIERVITAAQAFSLPSNKEILEVFPQDFIVDGEGHVKDPEGMRGIRLETEILAICCFSPYLKNLTQALAMADLDVLDIIPSGLASARAVLNSRQKELGVAVLDLGAWTTNLVVFEEGDLVHMAVFPVGSGHLTNDIAIGLQTDIDTAESIKLEFGDCLYQRKGKPEKIEIQLGNASKIKMQKEGKGKASFQLNLKTKNTSQPSKKKKEEKEQKQESLIFSRKLLTHIISARVAEIFDLAQKELKKIGRQKLLPAGIILTGGGAKLQNIDNFAKKEFKLPAQIGFPKGIHNFKEDTSLSVLAGLLLSSLDTEPEHHIYRPGFFSKLKRMFRIFVP